MIDHIIENNIEQYYVITENHIKDYANRWYVITDQFIIQKGQYQPKDLKLSYENCNKVYSQLT